VLCHMCVTVVPLDKIKSRKRIYTNAYSFLIWRRRELLEVVNTKLLMLIIAYYNRKKDAFTSRKVNYK